MAVQFLQDIRITSKLLDKDGDAGASGQVLSSTATGTDWITLNDIYYTETEADNRFVNVTGDTMTGQLLMDNAQILIDMDTPGSALTWRESDSSTIAGQLRAYVNRGDLYLYENGVQKAEITASTGSFVPDLTITNDLIVSGGDITLGGTGRIQGIDTVTDGTDAVNKNYVDNAIVDNYVRTAYIVLDSGTTGVTRTADSPSTGYTKFTLTPSTWFTSIYNNTRGFIVQVVDASTGQIVGAEIDLNTGTNDRIDIIFKGNVANSDFDANIVYTGVFGIA